MYKKIIFFSLIAFMFGILTYNFSPRTTVFSSLIPSLDKRELVNDSDVIIYGKVLDILESKWSNPNFEKGENIQNRIVTDVLVEVKKVYKGEPYNKKKIIVRVGYGEVGIEKMINKEEPAFQVGEEMILFLHKPDSLTEDVNENYYKTTGLLQGKFSLMEENETDKTFQNGTKSDTVKFSSVEKEIKDIIKDLDEKPIKKLKPEEIDKINRKTFGE